MSRFLMGIVKDVCVYVARSWLIKCCFKGGLDVVKREINTNLYIHLRG